MRELFVYYRVRVADAAALEAATDAVHRALRTRHRGLQTRLLRRTGATPDDRAAGVQTWMETYATDPEVSPGGVTAAIEAEIRSAAAALAGWTVGERHVEAFEPL